MSTREDRRTDLLSELRQDVAHTWRLVRRAPGFAIVAVVTLALGIGANTAIFSLVNGLLLRDLPYADADHVMRIWGSRTDRSRDRGQLSPAEFLDIRARQRTFATMGAFGFGGGTYIGPDDPVPLAGLRVDPNVLTALGVKPMLGRLFIAGDDSASATPTIVLGYKAWRNVFKGDSSIVGKSINFSGRTRTVIGVLPPAFFFPTVSGAEVFVPLDLMPVLRDVNRARKFHFLGAVGRLKPGVSVAAGQAELASLAR